MRNSVGWIGLVMLLGAGVACRPGEPQASAPAPAPEGREVQVFEPPADGRLTQAQVAIYAAVERRVADMAAAPAVESEAGDVLRDLTRASEAEVAAAEELGFDGAEYRWVKARVMEARQPRLGIAVSELAARMSQASLETLQRRRDQTRDPRERAQLEEEIADLEARLHGDAPARDSTAVEFNRALLERYLETPVEG
jgi:hypothetical protein